MIRSRARPPDRGGISCKQRPGACYRGAPLFGVQIVAPVAALPACGGISSVSEVAVDVAPVVVAVATAMVQVAVDRVSVTRSGVCREDGRNCQHGSKSEPHTSDHGWFFWVSGSLPPVVIRYTGSHPGNVAAARFFSRCLPELLVDVSFNRIMALRISDLRETG